MVAELAQIGVISDAGASSAGDAHKLLGGVDKVTDVRGEQFRLKRETLVDDGLSEVTFLDDTTQDQTRSEVILDTGLTGEAIGFAREGHEETLHTRRAGEPANSANYVRASSYYRCRSACSAWHGGVI